MWCSNPNFCYPASLLLMVCSPYWAKNSGFQSSFSSYTSILQGGKKKPRSSLLWSLKDISCPWKLNRASGIQPLWGSGHNCLPQSFGHMWTSFWTSCAGLRKRTVSQGSQWIMFHRSSQWLSTTKTEWKQVASVSVEAGMGIKSLHGLEGKELTLLTSNVPLL